MLFLVKVYKSDYAHQLKLDLALLLTKALKPISEGIKLGYLAFYFCGS